jgi:hypothetical protein
VKPGDAVNGKCRYLSLNDYHRQFVESWNQAKNLILKLETLMDYCLDHNNSDYIFFIQDSTDAFIRELTSYWNSEARESYKRLTRGELSFKRLHTIEQPLSKYIEYEYYSYVASEVLGEEIRIIDKSNTLAGDKLNEDFVIFDGYEMYIQDYGEKGNLHGAWHVTDSAVIACRITQFDTAFAKAENYRKLFDGDVNIISGIVSGIHL